MRITEAFQTVPGFLLALAAVRRHRADVPAMLITSPLLALGGWTRGRRVGARRMCSLRERDFVAAARTMT